MATTTKTHQKWRRDLVRGKVVRVPDADDLWVEPDFFADWNQFPYALFQMMKVRIYGVNGVERDDPLWHDAVRDLEARALNRRVEMEINTFDRSTMRFICQVWLREGGRRGAKVTVAPRYVQGAASGGRESKKTKKATVTPTIRAGSRARRPQKPKGMSTGVKAVACALLVGGIWWGISALTGGGEEPTA